MLSKFEFLLKIMKTAKNDLRFGRGRVLRDGTISRERKRICVLDRQSSDAFSYGYDEPCSGPQCRHRHQAREIVEQMVTSGVLRWLGKGKNVAGYVYGRTWKATPSGPEGGPKPIRVMQLV